MAELRSLLKKDEPTRLYAISVDEPAKSRELAEKIAADGQGAIAYSLLADTDRRTIDSYGLRDPAYAGQEFDGVPHPAVYVIDKTGRVAWAKYYQDYKQRPSHPEIRAALDAL